MWDYVLWTSHWHWINNDVFITGPSCLSPFIESTFFNMLIQSLDSIFNMIQYDSYHMKEPVVLIRHKTELQSTPLQRRSNSNSTTSYVHVEYRSTGRNARQDSAVSGFQVNLRYGPQEPHVYSYNCTGFCAISNKSVRTNHTKWQSHHRTGKERTGKAEVTG